MNSTSPIASASNIQMDYMKLLMAELQNQNPLEPLDNQQMAAQLAQFSQLQQLESMSSSFAEVLAATNRSYVNSLIGKEISYIFQDELTGVVERRRGEVDEIYDVDGENFLVVDRHSFGLKDIAESLIGKEILFFAKTQYGTDEINKGIVYEVSKNTAGESFLVVDGQAVDFQDVIADSLIGQEISFVSEDEVTGALENKSCTINEVYKNASGESVLIVGRFLDAEDVISVRN